jgi:hypothetical protein
MAYTQGEERGQGTLFPTVLEDLVRNDHVCRFIDAFVDSLKMAELGFERAAAAETGRPAIGMPIDPFRFARTSCNRRASPRR